MLNLDWAGLPILFSDVPGSGRWLPLLQAHAALLEAARDRVRVTAVASDEAVRRQYAESLELLRIAEDHTVGSGSPLVDVGSGGGFPGLVIAIVRPELEVHLVEPLQKRARLLAEMAAELGLRNVTVHPVRAEEAGRGQLRDSAAVVTARAVAELRELLEYTAPLAAPGGLLVFPKGSAFKEELDGAAAAMQELACDYQGFVPMRPEVSETLGLALFRKRAETPSRYPRRAGMPAKRPLV